MIRSLLVEDHVTHELLAESRRGELREVPEHAKDRGELKDDAYVQAAVDLLVGYREVRHLADDASPEDWPQAGVEMVLAGLERTDVDSSRR